jgi:hypothetical protein
LEQATPPTRKFPTFTPTAKIQKPWVKDGTPTEQKDPANIVELRVAGKCFKCREPWVPGHTKVCKGKQVYSIIVMSSAEGKEQLGVAEGVHSEEGEYFDAE